MYTSASRSWLTLVAKVVPRLITALYESQSGEPSVPDEMLYAMTGNASWLSPGPQSAQPIPLAFRLLLHCVEGFDTTKWKVVNDVWRSAFLVVGLVVERISKGSFHVILIASHYGAWAWQFQEEVFDGVTFLTPRCSADSKCVWLRVFSFEDFRCWEIVPYGPKGWLHKYHVKNKSPSAVHLARSNISRTIPQAAAHNAFLGVTDQWLTKLAHARCRFFDV